MDNALYMQGSEFKLRLTKNENVSYKHTKYMEYKKGGLRHICELRRHEGHLYKIKTCRTSIALHFFL
jgi:hypothetical protein